MFQGRHVFLDVAIVADDLPHRFRGGIGFNDDAMTIRAVLAGPVYARYRPQLPQAACEYDVGYADDQPIAGMGKQRREKGHQHDGANDP